MERLKVEKVAAARNRKLAVTTRARQSLTHEVSPEAAARFVVASATEKERRS